MKEILLAVKKFLRHRFNLDEDKADERLIIEAIRRDVTFKGTSLWTLIFAILIASIGLNVNSTAVVIGAMLISPLMGPIMGIGLGIGILDFELTKKGIKNIFIAAIISIITSSLYFTITPLQEANSELLARTTPSIWDVFIAFFGGLAGIIAGTRKEKSNILPGVAIATALMPPLCTAGFGIATGHWTYFFGALYLFFINCLFICLATFIIVRFLKFKTAQFANNSHYKKVMRYIWIISILTILPSLFLAFRIVQKAIFEQNARKFVQAEFNFAQTQVVSKIYRFDIKHPQIELLLIGQELSTPVIDSIRKKMPIYHLDTSWLDIKQGLNAKKEIDLAQIKASILEDVFSTVNKSDSINQPTKKSEFVLPDIKAELSILYPGLKEYSLSRTTFRHADTKKNDTITLFVGSFNRYLSRSEKIKLSTWLKERTSSDSVKVIIETLPVIK